jgi:hypothetical protein
MSKKHRNQLNARFERDREQHDKKQTFKHSDFHNKPFPNVRDEKVGDQMHEATQVDETPRRIRQEWQESAEQRSTAAALIAGLSSRRPIIDLTNHRRKQTAEPPAVSVEAIPETQNENGEEKQ